eukprot:GHUV01038772.1.p1 GENE.GHUV01038772.1~~GHUV01038772.1.p1  ORF type:complete len:101 (-),score=13.04 GHUV01038772.1:83-385(-)
MTMHRTLSILYIEQWFGSLSVGSSGSIYPRRRSRQQFPPGRQPGVQHAQVLQRITNCHKVATSAEGWCKHTCEARADVAVAESYSGRADSAITNPLCRGS